MYFWLVKRCGWLKVEAAEKSIHRSPHFPIPKFASLICGNILIRLVNSKLQVLRCDEKIQTTNNFETFLITNYAAPILDSQPNVPNCCFPSVKSSSSTKTNYTGAQQRVEEEWRDFRRQNNYNNYF
jgi:hypothetical protein